MRVSYTKQRHANWQQGINISFLLPVFILLVSVISIFTAVNPAQAVTTDTLNFQGRLLTNTGGLVSDGSYNIEFNLYTVDVGGSSEWTETHINSGSNPITVKNGYFSVYLGDATEGNPFPGTIDWDQEHWLGMTVRGTGSCAFVGCTPTDSEMTPRFKLTAVPYAFRAGAILDSAGNAYTGDDLVQTTPGTIQALNAAVSAIRFNQAGSGGLLQLQGDGTDVFTVDKTGAAILGAGITVGNSSSTTAGTIRWSGTDLEVYDGADWVTLTGAAGGVGVTAIKSSDETINSDATLTNDTDLNFSIAANDTWSFRFVVQGNSATQPDFQFAVSAPSGATCDVGVVDVEAAVGVSNLGCGVASGTIAGTGNDEVYEIVGTVVNGSNAGSVSLQWAQNSSNANNTTVYAGSYVLATSEGGSGGGGGGGGSSFEQNGNAFGTTAVLGTTDTFGLNIITDNVTRLSFTAAGDATFAKSLTVTTGGLTVSAGGLTLTGGIDNNSGGLTEAGAISGISSLTGTAALTVASGGSSDLTLDSASDVLILADSTLRRIAAGTTTIDLLDAGGGTTLSITNSDGTEVAGLSVEGAVSAASFSGVGSGLTSLSATNISSGTLNDGRLSSNVALLNTSQTFTGEPTFSSGLILGNSTSTTSGALRWSGTDFEGYDGVSWASLTGGGGGGGSSSPALTTINKTANEVVNNSTTLQNDDQLLFTVGANETWSFRFVVQANSPIAAGIKFAITAPSGATCQVAFIDQQTASSESGIGCAIASTSLTGTGNNEVYEIVGTIVNGSTAGDVRLQWAQTTAIGSNTTVLAGSYLTASIDGGGQVFLQDGNAFGGTAILGTTDSFGLNLIAGNTTALSLATDSTATFSGQILANGGLTIGNAASDSLTIVSDAVTITNGLNFDNNTLVIDASNNRIGIGDATPDNQLSINNAATTDANAVVSIYTDGVSNKGLIVQGTAAQAANLFEIQDSGGNTLAGFNASGELVLGLTTIDSTASSFRGISFPDASGIVCLSGSNCGFLELASGSHAVDATTNDSIAINKTGASGNIISLQKSGGAVFTVTNTGALQIQSTNSTALDIRNVGGTSYFSIDTSTGTVRVGPTTADANGVLFVLDTKNTAGDPTGVAGAQYYNSNLNKFRCYENGLWTDCINRIPLVRSFVDTTSDPLVDADTTDYWDTAAENNNSIPNITLSNTSNSVMGTISVEFDSSSTQDRDIVVRVERNIGSAPTCGSSTVVGGKIGVFTTNSGARKSGTVTFIDDVATTSDVYYTVCSDVDTSSANGISVLRIRVTLQEVENSN